MNIELILIAALFSLLSLCIGIVLLAEPKHAIEIQRRFYEKINWKIEPLSMQKEIRNTRIMGLFLITVSLLTSVYIIGRFAMR